LAPPQFLEFIQQRSPGGFIVELADNFLRNNVHTGRKYMEELAQALSALGYAVRALKLGHGDWVSHMTRTGTILVGFGEDVGHVRAAEWFTDAFGKSRNHISSVGPVEIWDLIDTKAAEERERTEQVEVRERVGTTSY